MLQCLLVWAKLARAQLMMRLVLSEWINLIPWASYMFAILVLDVPVTRMVKEFMFLDVFAISIARFGRIPVTLCSVRNVATVDAGIVVVLVTDMAVGPGMRRLVGI